jgi:hypothetical protein
LKRYREERDGRLMRRWQALWLPRQGRTMQEAAATVGVAYRTVQNGSAGTGPAAFEGLARPAAADYGAPARCATGKAPLARADEELSVRLTDRQLARQFRRLGARSKLPRPIAGRADPTTWAAWIASASARS